MGRLHAAACAVADAAGSRVAPMAPGGRGGTRRLALRAAGGHVPGLLGVERDDLAVEDGRRRPRSEEHTSELQSLMRISYAVFCLKKKKRTTTTRALYDTQ